MTNELTVLVSGAGSVLGYGAVRLISKYKGITNLFVANTIAQCPAANYAKKTIVTPDYYFSKSATEDEYIEYVLDFSKKNGVNLIIPCSIFELKSYAKNIEKFKQIGVRVFVENIEYIESFFDKYETSILLNKKGVYAPVTRLINNNLKPEEMNFPCIVKPRYGYGSNGIKVLENENAYSEWYDKNSKNKYAPYVCQDYLEDEKEEYSCVVLFDDQSTPFHASVIRREKINKVTTEAIYDEQCTELESVMMEISTALDGQYCLNFQFRLSEGKPYIFEVNPRFGAAEAIRAAFGMDSYYLLMKKYFDIHKAQNKRYGKVIRAYQEEYFPLK